MEAHTTQRSTGTSKTLDSFGHATVIIRSKGLSHPSYALLDTGANCCAVSKNIVNKLNMTIESLKLNLGTFDDEPKLVQKDVTSFNITDLKNTIEIEVRNAIISNMLTTGNKFPIRNETIENVNYL